MNNEEDERLDGVALGDGLRCVVALLAVSVGLGGGRSGSRSGALDDEKVGELAAELSLSRRRLGCLLILMVV